MDYKKFCKIFVTLLFGSIVLCVIVSVYVDPYNVLHWDNVRSNGIEPNKNYIKTRYIINNPSKYNAFVFGSSRVGAIHVDKIKDLMTYNMTYSAGTPDEHLANIRTFLKNNVDVRRIYVGIDDILLGESERQHRTPLRCSYEHLTAQPKEFFSLYLLNPKMIVGSLKHLKRNVFSNDIDQMYKNGWWCGYDRTSRYEWPKIENLARYKSNINWRFFNEALQSIKEIKQICDKNGVELIIFTNPTYRTTYIRGLNCGYIEFLQELSKMTDFYNFSGLNDVTTDRNNYLETSHYKANVGDILIDVLCNNKRFDGLYEQGFGWHVTKDNIDELIRLVDIPVEN